MKWITEKGLNLERMACVWMIKRFLDPNPQFYFVPGEQVDSVLTEIKGIPFDVEGAELAAGPTISAFDKILFVYRFTNPALDRLGGLLHRFTIKKFEDTLTQAGCTQLLSRLTAVYQSDEECVEQTMEVYDAIYRFFKDDILSKKVVPPMNINKVL